MSQVAPQFLEDAPALVNIVRGITLTLAGLTLLVCATRVGVLSFCILRVLEFSRLELTRIWLVVPAKICSLLFRC